MKRDKDLQPRFWFSLLFTFPFFVRAIDPTIQWLLATIILVVGNYSFFQKAYKKSISIYTLFSASVGILYAYSLLEGLLSSHPTLYYGMVASLTTLILLEQLVEEHIENKVAERLQALSLNAPKKAVKLFPDGHSEEVAVDVLRSGDTLRIAAGDIVPVDGIVLADEVEVNESLISGVDVAIKKVLGSAVYAGTRTLSGSCLIRATRVSKKSLFVQILAIVKEALNSRSPIQERVSKLATGIMLGLFAFSFLIFLFWALFSSLASAILVLSTLFIAVCPCAMLLGAQIVSKMAIIEGARQGIVIKNVKSIIELASCNILVTNKNSTLTTGQPTIVSLDPAEGVSADELLITAASLEPKSLHPYALCIVEKAASLPQTLMEIEDIQEVPGLGVKGTLDGVTYLVGDEKLMGAIDTGYFKVRAEDMRKQGYIVLFCAKGQKLLGILVISDPIRPDVKDTLKTLKSEGLQLFCLSGDRRVTIVQLVHALGFDRFQAEAAPQEKIQTIRRLQKEGKTVLMVGDPVNDAEALAQADCGISLGTRGNMVEEKAPIVLISPTLSSSLRVFMLGKRASSILKQNIAISAGFMVVMLFMAAFGGLGPAHGAFYMMLSTLVVGYNSLRIYEH